MNFKHILNRKYMVVFIVVFVSINYSDSYASDWDDQIALYLDTYKKSETNPKPIVYPKLGDRVRNVFLLLDKSHVVIDLRKNEEAHIRTELFYTKGELHIRDGNEFWNMVTLGDYVYEWKTGSDVGIKIKKNEQDIVDYILYITDPSYIIASIYYDYTSNHEAFNIIAEPDKPWKEIAYKKSNQGFEAIFVDEDQFWFHGFRLSNPRTGDTVTSQIHKPTTYNEIPADLMEAMKQIKFKNSDLTLRRHLTYL